MSFPFWKRNSAGAKKLDAASIHANQRRWKTSGSFSGIDHEEIRKIGAHLGGRSRRKLALRVRAGRRDGTTERANDGACDRMRRDADRDAAALHERGGQPWL